MRSEDREPVRLAALEQIATDPPAQKSAFRPEIRIAAMNIAAHLAEAIGAEHLELVDKQRSPGWLVARVSRSAVGRALLAARAGREYDGLVIAWGSGLGNPFIVALLATQVLLRRRKLVVIEFMRHARPRPRLRTLLRDGLGRLLGWALARSALRLHVITAWEAPHYARLLRIPEELFTHVQLSLDAPQGPAKTALSLASSGSDDDPPSVMVSGECACDWETALTALGPTPWGIIIVCPAARIDEVLDTARRHRPDLVNVECHPQLPFAEYCALLKRASVYLLCLEETNGAVGQARIRLATLAGTATVATSVRGIDGYVIDGKTALCVPAARADLTRAAVAELMGDAEGRETLVRQAREFASRFSREEYTRAIKTLVEDAVNVRPRAR